MPALDPFAFIPPPFVVRMAPWSVFLMVNVAQEPIRECEIHVHDNPDTMVFWRNWFTSPFKQRWVILMRITTASKNMAQLLQKKWLDKTRGVPRLIAKAFYLAKPLVELGKADLEIIPWTLPEEKRLLQSQFLHGALDWPPRPLEKQLYVRSISDHRTSTADYIRMHDIQTDALQDIPVQVLENFIQVMSQ